MRHVQQVAGEFLPDDDGAVGVWNPHLSIWRFRNSLLTFDRNAACAKGKLC
jgi:hypothetical protein